MFSRISNYVLATTLVLVTTAALVQWNTAALASDGKKSSDKAVPVNATVDGVLARNERDAATIVLKIKGDVSYKTTTMKQSAIVVFDIAGTTCNPESLQYTATRDSQLVRSVRTVQVSPEQRSITRVSIELATLAPFVARPVTEGVQIDFAGGVSLAHSIDELQHGILELRSTQTTAEIQAKPLVDGTSALSRFVTVASGIQNNTLPVANAAKSGAKSFAVKFSSAVQNINNRALAKQEDALIALNAAIENKRQILMADAAIDVRMSELEHQLQEVQQPSIDLSGPQFDVLGAQDSQAPAAEPSNAAPAPVEGEKDRPAPSGKAVAERLQNIVAPAEEQAKLAGAVKESNAAPAPDASAAKSTPLPAATGDPLDKIVDLDFREAELSNVVTLLAQTAQVNVIGGTELTGQVTAKLKNIPLRSALEIVLEMNGLGVIEDRGVFKIVPLTEAKLADRVQEIVFLKNGKADEVAKTLEGATVGSADQELISITPNESTNVVIISGPSSRVAELSELAKRIDVAEPTLTVVTEAIHLDYSNTNDMLPVVKTMLTEGIGKVGEDPISRSVIVTDAPVVVEQVREVIKAIDLPMKQVLIRAMIVDAVLRDGSQMGSNWSVKLRPRVNTRGETVGNLENMSLSAGLASAIGTEVLDAGAFTFGTLSSDFDITATIAAEVAGRNAKILANPTIVTIENKKAEINITQEFPYQELTQSTTGPPIASTEFKDIGVTLSVTPRVTNDNHIITDLQAKESSVSGLSSGVPIEDKREAVTTLRTISGQTAYIGGLRNISDRLEVSKIPLLGDVPVLNFLFKNTTTEKINTELLIFLTCNVLQPELPLPSDEQQTRMDELGLTPIVPDGQRAMFRHFLRPQEFRDPFWKWRRTD
jgi:type II secretory pathway component GspD/PulD (secretin)